MRHSGIKVIVPSLLMVIILGACHAPSTKQAGPPEKITLAYSTAYNAILVHVAFAKGFFVEEGLDVVPQPHAFGKMALHATIEGKADLATVGDTPTMFAVMNGQKIAIIAVIQTSAKDNAIVARQDRGITDPSDLKGKTIGVTGGTTADFFADTFLIAHSIDKKQVTIIDLKPDEMATALSTGKVDAVSTWNPVLTQLHTAMGNKGRVFFGENLYVEQFCLVGKEEFVKTHPEAINRVLRALIKAEAFVQKNPEESRRLVADFTRADKTVLDTIWGDFSFRVALTQALIADLEDQTRWAVKYRLEKGTTMPDYLNFIYMDGLEAVKPEAVSIIR